MNYIEAVLLGIVQGLTEFLPISSSGHLVVVQNWLDLAPDAPEILAFDIVSHLGTLLAMLVVFWKPAKRMMTNRRYGPRILGLAAVATVVTGVIGLLWKDWFESRFAHAAFVGVELIISGALLYVTTLVRRPRKGWREFCYPAAALVGLAQAISILPGISRSGATICTAMLLGLRRRWAAQFSFLIAAPAILGAAGLLLKDFFEKVPAERVSGMVGPLLVGGAVAFVVGLLALLLLLQMIQRSRLHWFTYYLWVVGIAVIVAG